MALTTKDIAEVIADEVQTAVKDATDSLRERIAVLESRVAIQETKSAAVGCRWVGTYHPDGVYPEGSLLTCAGSLWLVKHTTSERPPSRDYVLVVKRGEAAE